jgi:hypothetical protein
MVAEIDRVACKISNAFMSLVDLARQDRSRTGNSTHAIRRDVWQSLAVVWNTSSFLFHSFTKYGFLNHSGESSSSLKSE